MLTTSVIPCVQTIVTDRRLVILEFSQDASLHHCWTSKHLVQDQQILEGEAERYLVAWPRHTIQLKGHYQTAKNLTVVIGRRC
jgi:hypothetical protein